MSTGLAFSASVAAPQTISSERRVAGISIGALCIILILIIALPLWSLLSKSFESMDGSFVGLDNYLTYFTTPTLFVSLQNSLFVAAVSTAIVIPLAFAYAYALTRTRMPAKGMFYALALLPIFAPSLLAAISLVYIFGNQGFLGFLLMGNSVYGPIGIIMGEVLSTFPHALLILVTALSLADGRLYEAAEALGTSKARVFWTITLPGARFGVVNATFVVFTLVITDFGVPKVIGGQYDVLATDAYKQVVGQQNFSMGAVVGMILLVPALIAFVVDKISKRHQVALLSARAVPLEPPVNRRLATIYLLFCLAVGGTIVGSYGVSVWASFIQYWPYNLAFTLNNYDFSNVEPSGWQPYFNSLTMAALVSVIGSALVFWGAYLIEKTKAFPRGRAVAHFLAMLPMAVPGLVLGLGYVFFFNASWNPLSFLYGTLALLVINTLGHFYTVSHLTALTALKQIDGEFEAVSASLKVPFWRTFGAVTVPICAPTILDISVYMFVNAMTTVSAVIFLYGADSKLASIAIVHMDEAGAGASAAAMATMIMVTAIGVKLLHIILAHAIFNRLQRWRRRAIA